VTDLTAQALESMVMKASTRVLCRYLVAAHSGFPWPELAGTETYQAVESEIVRRAGWSEDNARTIVRTLASVGSNE
jgi:hypothetical protein